MNVTQAVAERRSVRAFLSDPVPVEQLLDLARRAARAATGGNLQPWHVDLVAGAAMSRLKILMAERVAAGTVEEPGYTVYPPALSTPYRDRRFAVGEAMYAQLGIAHDDKAARRAWFARNFAFFGAPAGFFVTVDRAMGPPQWADLGMYLQTLMLLATEAGLASCAQEAWAAFPATVEDFLRTPPERMLFCGVAIGFEDAEAPVNRLRSERAPDTEWLSVVA